LRVVAGARINNLNQAILRVPRVGIGVVGGHIAVSRVEPVALLIVIGNVSNETLNISYRRSVAVLALLPSAIYIAMISFQTVLAS
jgi:hypothetical protein